MNAVSDKSICTYHDSLMSADKETPFYYYFKYISYTLLITKNKENKLIM